MTEAVREITVKRYLDNRGREHATRRDAALASLANTFKGDWDCVADSKGYSIHTINDLLAVLAEGYPFTGDLCDQFSAAYGDAFIADFEEDDVPAEEDKPDPIEAESILAEETQRNSAERFAEGPSRGWQGGEGRWD